MLVHVALALDSGIDRARYEAGLEALPDVVHRTVEGRADLWRHLNKEDVDLVIVGLDVLPADREAFLRSVRSLPEGPEIVVVGANDDPATRARLLAAGCLAVMPQELPDDVVREVLPALVGRRRSEAIARIRAERPEERYSLADFVSDSPAMSLFLDMARKLVDSESSVLILGETGVGKERLARAIHSEGARGRGPFLAINCGALTESLLESELFGHEEGAFTGAHRARKGFFELAHRGTLFLDEIGEMSPAMQVKLLRVLEERHVMRVGAERPLPIDVRVMAATHRNLEEEMQAGRFRADLFFRLAVVTLRIPPLRERRADIPPLARSYLEHFRLQTGRHIARFSDEALAVLVEYDWPGNVRELINAVERAVLVCEGEGIEAEDLPRRITGRAAGAGAAEAQAGGPEPEPPNVIDQPFAEGRKLWVERFERRYLRALLSSTEGRIGDAAARAEVSARTLYAMMRRHGLRKEDFKGPSR